MQSIEPSARRSPRLTSPARKVLAPALALLAVALTTQVARAVSGMQAKPQLNVEAERSPQGAKLTFKGKSWPANARVKITATRAPGAANAQDFGMYSADSTGTLNGRKVVACSTTRDEDSNEIVTFTAADSASGVKATAKVNGGAWVCQ
jgi:hypothetical protein